MNIPTMKTNNRDMLVSLATSASSAVRAIDVCHRWSAALVVMMHAGRYRACDDSDSNSSGVRVLLDRCAAAEGEKAKNGESFH
jgi:hypothetical protein